MANAKVGATHAQGMFRKGLTELAQFLPAFNNAGSQIQEDAAVWPNVTPGEIAQARKGPHEGPEQESPVGSMTLQGLRDFADQSAKEAENRMEQSPTQTRGAELERDGMEM
jgi:hypothetical protein